MTATGLRLERSGDRVRLITRNGYDWTSRYPWIVEIRAEEPDEAVCDRPRGVILGVDGVSDFDALHSGKRNDEVQLYPFDMLACDGEDLRALPLGLRKTNLANR